MALPLPPELQRLLEQDKLITMVEVAAVLRVPLYTAREWGRRGLFPTVQIGRRVFVRAVAFHRWIETHERGANHD